MNFEDLTFGSDLEETESVSSDYTDYSAVATTEIFQITDPNDIKGNAGLKSRDMTFTSLDDNDDLKIDSDEEKSIINEIKQEITSQVRQEMSDELALYKYKRENLKTPADKPNDLDGVEPKLKDAILKMRKLDKILIKKSRREKEVKRERIMLHKRLSEQLENLKSEYPDEPRDSRSNTNKFLALTLPERHDAGVSVNEENSEYEDVLSAVSPVFQTQVLEEQTDVANESEKRSPSSANQSESRSGRNSNITSNTSSTSGRGDQNSHKDFIRRNIELASDAGNALAMTDDEKQRIETLLADLDSMPEDVLDVPHDLNEITISNGEGFVPTSDEAKKLHDIDSQLRLLLPESDFNDIASASSRSNTSNQTILFTRTAIDELGEKALQDTKEQQVLKRRMQDIEHELGRLTSCVELEIESPSLSDNQLQELLDQCSRTMARATEDVDSIANPSTHDLQSISTSSRASLYENPPKLSEDILQQLLTEARQSLGNSFRSNRDNNADQLLIESVTEDTIKELLKDSRATSRSASRMLNIESTERTMNYSDDEKNESKSSTPFLPEINPSGSLINNWDQMQNPQNRPNSQGRSLSPKNNSITELFTKYSNFNARDSERRPSSQAYYKRSETGKKEKPRMLSPIYKHQ